MYDFRYFMIWYKCGKIKNRTKIKKTDLFDKLKTLLLCAPKKLKLLIEKLF